jgi:hypothetical protein
MVIPQEVTACDRILASDLDNWNKRDKVIEQQKHFIYKRVWPAQGILPSIFRKARG